AAAHRLHQSALVVGGRSRPSPTNYSGSGRSTMIWHSVQTQVRRTAFVRSSRRSVQGTRACRPHRGQRSGRAPGGSVVGSHGTFRSEEHTSELQSRFDLVCRLLLEKKKE